MPHFDDERPGHDNCDNAAVMRGYTRHVLIDFGTSSFAALIKPEQDLDERFKCFDTDSQEWRMVNGWMVADIEDAD